MACHIVNLERGMPTVAVAHRLLEQSVRSAKALGTKQLKIIHGYGSSGKGGAIRRDARRYLQQKKEEGVIRDFIPGEEFTPFSERTRQAIARYPDLCKDSDYFRENDGVTIVIF